MTHSKERNFVCSECGERFRSKGQMELHATRRHNPDTRPSIPCEECGKLFRIQADLRNHLSRTHRARLERQHRCNDCDLTFRSEKSLISHMTLHDPGRPLQCSRCSLRYKNKDALGTIHILRKHLYSVSHNFIAPSKELYSKMDLGEVGVSLP